MRDVASLTRHLSKPAIHLVTAAGPSGSHFGGCPGLPPDVAWPTLNGKRLGFLARLSLPELHRVRQLPWLPETGALIFFYDVEGQPWGYDAEHRGGAAVLYVSTLPSVAPHEAKPEGAVAFRHVEFRKIESLPSWERRPIQALGLSDMESDVYSNLEDVPFRDEPRHQIDGYPRPVQCDTMELGCERIFRGVEREDESVDEILRAQEAAAREWRLLLQMDSDDELGVMWGDAGMLYFWVREAEARAGRFENVWVILQCC
jgi:uncharacterized protein YwqG